MARQHGFTRFLPVDHIKLLVPYVVPLFSVGLALQVNWLIAPFLSFLPPFLTFLAAIMVTAWYAGLPSAVFGIALSAFTLNYYFFPPIADLHIKPADAGTIGFFVVEALAMAYCINYLRDNEAALRRANEELAQQVSNKHKELSQKEEGLRGLMYQLATTEERERRQLAEELHDYLAQLLTLARMKMKQAEQHAHQSVAETHRFIREADELLRTSGNYVRTLMAELHPPQLHELGLAAALRWLAEQMPRHGLAVEVSITRESLAISNETVLLLYQSVRELLMNVVKHASVERAFLSLDVQSECLCITVQDFGQGFDPMTGRSSRPGQHFGLQNVRERITTIGGTFALESAVGKGTSIALTVPFETVSEAVVLRAASKCYPDRIETKPEPVPGQQSLPL